MPELLKKRRTGVGGKTTAFVKKKPTRDVDVHAAGASPDAVGGVADVRAGQVVGHRTLEEQGVVLDLHISGQGAVQAVVRERERQ